jgi:hypothetical protein
MIYTDDFFKALGAWQRGWREEPERRRLVTTELLTAIETLPAPLPKRSPLPLCYRKRFLMAHNPQNDTDMSDLILHGLIDEGIAAWTTDPEFGRMFKDLIRKGSITALFEHQPADDAVVVDIPQLWNDPAFVRDFDAYKAGGGEQADALEHFKDRQSEVILNAPLLRQDVCGFVGEVGTHDALFAAAAVTAEDEQDDLIDRMIAANVYPGQARWLGREGSQRALRRTAQTILQRLAAARDR